MINYTTLMKMKMPPAEECRKHSLCVAIPGRGGDQIYKSTLVSMLICHVDDVTFVRLQRVHQ